MNDLDKLIEKYSDYLDSIRYNKEPAKDSLPRLLEDSEGMIKNFVLWLASRPTCGVEQRKFLDEVEKRGKINASNDLGFSDEDTNNIMDMTSFLFQKTFKSDLKKVIDGE